MVSNIKSLGVCPPILVVVLFMRCGYPVQLLQFCRSYPSRFHTVWCKHLVASLSLVIILVMLLRFCCWGASPVLLRNVTARRSLTQINFDI